MKIDVESNAERNTESKVIVALDFAGEKAALEFVERLTPSLCKLKIGKELFTACGPALVRQLVDRGYDVFLDLKYHDIPNTVANACRAAADLGVWMLNVHALGGEAMMSAARNALAFNGAPRLIAVTWLTSSGQRELDDLGLQTTPADFVVRLASMAARCELDGVVCSAQEATVLRKAIAGDFLLVTPGIRLPDSDKGDQQRICTPQQAIDSGASHLVIGRPVTQAADPCQTLLTINASIA